MTVAEELRKHADLAIKEGGMYYSGSYLDALAKRAESEQAVAAKLRELCRMLSSLADNGLMELDDDDFTMVMERMRELGVEVDDGN